MKLAPEYTVLPIDPTRMFNGVEYSVEYRYEDIVTDEGKEVRRKVEGSGHLVSKPTTSQGGFLVKFPNGNSIRIADETQLEAMGFNVAGGLVDLDSGEKVPLDETGRVDFRAMIATTAIQKSGDGQMDLLGEREEA